MPNQINISAPEDTDTEKLKKVLSPKEAMLMSLGGALDIKFHEYSVARQVKEDEWTKAIRQYDGLWDADDRTKIEKALGYDVDTQPPPVNITRPKTNIAIARMQDSQFPVGGDHNFTMRPLPVPQAIKDALSVTDPNPGMMAEAAAQGIPEEAVPSPQAVAQAIIDEEHEASRIMTQEIENDLVKTSYGRKARRAIEDQAILGTAVVKGPILSPHVQMVYSPEVTDDEETIQVLGSMTEFQGDTFRVDPRLCYPDPSARMPDEIEDLFELHIMSASKLAKLAESPAFMRSQVAKVLMKGPESTVLPTSITHTAYLNSTIITKNRFLVKEYHGPIDKQALYDGGVIDEDDFDDPLATFFGEIWFCEGIIIRMSLSYLEGASSVPYGFASWERDPGSVFGHGVPFLLRHPQRVINNAYLLLLDNASLTSGPQAVLNKEMIEPADPDGSYDIQPMKVWFLTEYGADVREAMQFIDVPAQIDGISHIIDMAMQFSDMESSTPLMQQGDMPTGNNTLTGMAKVMTATNINQKRASMNWDDYITVPLIDRYYHHQMQYGENEAAKGNYYVQIGGATERIESELRAQELERLMGLAMSDEKFSMQVDPVKAFRQLATLIRAGDILRSEAEINEEMAKMQAQQDSQQPDPEGMKAQAAMITAQARAQEAQASAQAEEMRMQLEQERLMVDREKAQLEALARREQAFASIQASQDRKDTELAKLAVMQDKTAKEIARDLQIASVNNETERTSLAVGLTKFREEVAVKRESGEGI